MKITVCPFCLKDIDPEFPACCGEWGHVEEMDVCEECGDELIEDGCPTCTKIEIHEKNQQLMEASCHV